MTPERLTVLDAYRNWYCRDSLGCDQAVRTLAAEVDRLRAEVERKDAALREALKTFGPLESVTRFRGEPVWGELRAALSPSPEPRATIGGGDCGVCYLNPCCCAPPPPRESPGGVQGRRQNAETPKEK